MQLGLLLTVFVGFLKARDVAGYFMDLTLQAGAHGVKATNSLSKRGQCAPYTGSTCGEHLKGQLVKIPPGSTLNAMERRIRLWLSTAYQSRTVSNQCWPHAKLLVCRHSFPSCNVVKPFCQDDCRVLETLVCRKEFLMARSIAAVKDYIPDCYMLPKKLPGNETCTPLASFKQADSSPVSMWSSSAPTNATVALHKRGHLRCWFHVSRIRSTRDVQVTWSRGRKVISAKRRRRRFRVKITRSGPHRLGVVLVISRALKRDRGQYTCTVRIGSETSTCAVGLQVVKEKRTKGKRRIKHLMSTGADRVPGSPTKSPSRKGKQRPISSSRYGQCRSYNGRVCANIFKNHSRDNLVFEYNYSPQYLVERQLLSELKSMESRRGISKRCKERGLEVLCFHMFQACSTSKDQGPVPRLCKRDCLAFHEVYCKQEVSGRGMGLLDLAPDCHSLLDNDTNCISLTDHPGTTAGPGTKRSFLPTAENGTVASPSRTSSIGIQQIAMSYIVPVAAGAVAVTMAIVALVLCRKKSRSRNNYKYNNNNLSSGGSDKMKCGKLKETDIAYREQIGEGDQCVLWLADIGSKRKGKKRFIVEKAKPGDESLLCEIESLRKLKHANLLIPSYASSPSQQSFLVYDISCLSDLKLELQMIRQPILSVTLNRFILSACAQVASAMSYLHSRGLVHGDISAHCCYVNMETGNVRLARRGFGSYLHSIDYVMHKAVGAMPVRWMSPEALDDLLWTPQSDVWSFGIFVWELYCFGEMPYKNWSNSEALEKITSYSLLSRPDNCPEKIFSFVEKCWHSSPEQRPSSEMIEDIFIDWCPDPLADQSQDGDMNTTAPSSC